MRVSSQASESTYVAQPPRDRGDWSWRAAQFASLRANAAQTEGGLMPLVDGLARRGRTRWLALGGRSAYQGTGRGGKSGGSRAHCPWARLGKYLGAKMYGPAVRRKVEC